MPETQMVAALNLRHPRDPECRGQQHDFCARQPVDRRLDLVKP